MVPGPAMNAEIQCPVDVVLVLLVVRLVAPILTLVALLALLALALVAQKSLHALPSRHAPV